MQEVPVTLQTGLTLMSRDTREKYYRDTYSFYICTF